MHSNWPGIGQRQRRVAAALVGLAVIAACERNTARTADTGTRVPQTAARPAPPSGPKVVFLGDSLTAGYGLDAGDAFPGVVQRRLTAAGIDAEVVNAGVSGDTSAGGLRRVDWALDGDARVLVIALGGNDALRGLSTEDLRRNLAAIIEHARKRNVTVILAGMEAPPNLGASYTSAFRKVYRELAAAYGIQLIPFLLQGIAGNGALNQADGIHPNAEGARRVADIVWPYVERAVRAAEIHD